MAILTSRTTLNRRQTLKAGGTAALIAALKSAFPSGAFAQPSGPETSKASLGYVALTDAAPLIMAKEKGFFAKHGLRDVDLVKRLSWDAIRDTLLFGSDRNGVDGAHILTPLPYFMSLGRMGDDASPPSPLPMSILARMNLDGQAISVSNEYRDLVVGLDASPLRFDLKFQKATVKWVQAGMTFAGGTHDLWLRYWLAAGGIDPDEDIETLALTPQQMMSKMRLGAMDVFCVGEPWSASLVKRKIGYAAAATGEIWPKHPEKSLAVRTDWLEKHPRAAKAMTMAVMEAQMWCDKPENRKETYNILSRPEWFNSSAADMIDRANGVFDYGTGRVAKNSPHFAKFWRDDASYPFKSHDLWFLMENIRWGRLEPELDAKALVNQVNREDVWRDAAKTLGVKDVPASTSRGKETFFDGKVFDPDKPADYLANLNVSRLSGG